MVAWLRASAPVQAVAGTLPDGSAAVFGEVLPEHYDPTGNPALVVSLKSGERHAEVLPLLEAFIQVKSWAGVNQYVLARQLAGAVSDTMHGAYAVTGPYGGTVNGCFETLAPVGEVDPDAHWATMRAEYKIQATPITD